MGLVHMNPSQRAFCGAAWFRLWPILVGCHPHCLACFTPLIGCVTIQPHAGGVGYFRCPLEGKAPGAFESAWLWAIVPKDRPPRLKCFGCRCQSGNTLFFIFPASVSPFDGKQTFCCHADSFCSVLLNAHSWTSCTRIICNSNCEGKRSTCSRKHPENTLLQSHMQAFCPQTVRKRVVFPHSLQSPHL